MIKFSDWIKIKESSSATRLKTQAALGLAPPVADIFSRATPPPWQVKNLKKALKKSHKKKRKKKTKHMFDEASKARAVNPDFDRFIKSIESLAKDIYELQTLMKKKSAVKAKKVDLKKDDNKKADDKSTKNKDKEFKDKKIQDNAKEKQEKQKIKKVKIVKTIGVDQDND